MLDKLFGVGVIINLIDKFSNPMEKVVSSVNSLERANETISKFSHGLIGVGTAGIIAGAGFVSAAGKMEGYLSQLEVMLGDTELAKQRLKELDTFSDIAPFDLDNVIEFGNSLQTVGRYSIQMMTDLGDLAAGARKPLDQVGNAIKKLNSGQKGEALMMFQDLLVTKADWNKALGKDVAEATVEEMMNSIHTVIKNKNFSGMMEKMSKTFEGSMSNLRGSVLRFASVYGKVFLEPTKTVVNSITSILNALAKWGDAHPILSSIIMGFLGTVTILLVPLGLLLLLYTNISKIKTTLITNAGMLKKSFSMLTTSLWQNVTATAAFQNAQMAMWTAQGMGMGKMSSTIWGIKAFSQTLLKQAIPAVLRFTAALLTNPLTWIIVGVVALAAAIYSLNKHFDIIKDSWNNLINPLKNELKILKNTFLEAFSPLKDFFKNIFGGATDKFDDFVYWVSFGFGFLFGIVTGFWIIVLTSWLKGINTFIGSFKSAFKKFGDGDIIGGLIDIFSAPYKTIEVTFKSLFDRIPKYAKPLFVLFGHLFLPIIALKNAVLSFFESIQTGIEKIKKGNILGGIFNIASSGIKAVFSILVEPFKMFYRFVKSIFDCLPKPIQDKILAIRSFFFKTILNIRDFFLNIPSFIKNGFEAIIPVIAKIIEKIIKKVSQIKNYLFDFFGGKIKSAMGSVDSLLKNIFGNNHISFKFNLNDIKTGIKSIWKVITETFKIENLIGGLKGLGNIFIAPINGLIAGLNSIKIDFPKWLPGVGGQSFGFNIKPIPAFATGVRNFGGGLALVGEKGPELLHLSKGTNVYTNKETNQILSKKNNNTNNSKTTINKNTKIEVNIKASDLDDLNSIKRFLMMLEKEGKEIYAI